MNYSYKLFLEKLCTEICPYTGNLVPRNESLVPKHESMVPKHESLVPKHERLLQMDFMAYKFMLWVRVVFTQ